IGDRADDVQRAVEGHEPAVVGVGRPREATDAGRGGAAQEDQRESAGSGMTSGEGQQSERRRRCPRPRRDAHQVAAAIVLISIVCMPWSMRWTPVIFTCVSANGSRREFCGSPGLELTGM